MLLAGSALFFIEQILPSLQNSTKKMLGIARMSMNWNVDQIVEILKNKQLPFDPAYINVMQEAVQTKGFYTSREFFKLLTFQEYDDVDFDESEGCNIIHNLNLILPEQYHNQYDFIFENGTIEHIFDIKNAIASTALATKVGGYVLHCSPLDAFNHGFYNFSLNFFADFYRVNGFGDFKFYLLRGSADWIKGNQDVLYEAFAYTHEEFQINADIYTTPFNKLGLAFFAKKQKHFATTQIPTQAAYDKSLQLSSVLNTW